ncbi:ATPase [Pseudomonas mangiferae]|uniref:ATPase n=1 Tax=Pseudomonas mangiferae TaxID=2593654 RepID=A0A553H3K4_9PSED|nr:ATPase [Pseudomonas mangiferae]TRX76335.1 ATPase [Pseudomonas mangiferae]
MRNDALDEVDDVPSLTTDVHDHDYGPVRDGREPYAPAARPAKARRSGGLGTGPLWALVGALVIALGGLGAWSFQQISLMEQQLVATQESFARISEEAAGRIQAISGKVVATESSVTSGSEALRLRVKQLETRLAELDKQQQGATGAQDGLDKRLAQLGTDLKALQDAGVSLAERLKAVDELQAKVQADQAAQAQLDTQLKALANDVAALKKQGDPTPNIARLEQDLLVLRSELDARAAAATSNAGNTAEFDAFRGQVTRNISALQSQVQNLQHQLNAR